MNRKYEKYLKAWKKRERETGIKTAEIRQDAIRTASRLAALISQYPGVNKVVLFGSTLLPGRFHEWSDIDLAVWGLPAGEYFHLLNKLENATDFPVDLVPAEDARPRLLNRIEEKGEILYEQKHD